MDEKKDIVDTAVAAGMFTTLVTALQQDPAWVEMLKGNGPFTVFAPNDDAFKAALEKLGITAEQLLADKANLGKILTYHVVAGKTWMAADIMALSSEASVTTVEGQDIKVSNDGNGVWVNGVRVIKADIECSNGVIHVIDGVLMPPTTEAPAAEEPMMEKSAETDMSSESEVEPVSAMPAEMPEPAPAM